MYSVRSFSFPRINTVKTSIASRLYPTDHQLNSDTEAVSDSFSLGKQDILNPSRQLQRVIARNVLCYWAVREFGMSGSELSHILGLNQSSVSRAVGRREKHVNDRRLKLTEA